MNDLLNTTLVRREDLYGKSASPSSSPDPELVQLVQEKAQGEFKIIERSGDVHISPEAVEDNDHVEFRLFASKSSTKPAQKVRVRSPSIDAQGQGFVQPNRPRSYYFADEPSPTALAQFQMASVGGSEVIARSKLRCPGCDLPWRVMPIVPSQDLASSRTAEVGSSASHASGSKRTRPGKKHRINVRTKRAAAAVVAAEKQQLEADREAAEREKRTRRNREKKVKKKERDKAKKAASEGD